MRGLSVDVAIIEELLAEEKDLNSALAKAKTKLIEIDNVLIYYPCLKLKNQRIKLNKFLCFFNSKKYEYSLSQLKIRAPQLFGAKTSSANES